VDESVVKYFVDASSAIEEMKELLSGSTFIAIKTQGYLYEPSLLTLANK
jgi:hypothetical protein